MIKFETHLLTDIDRIEDIGALHDHMIEEIRDSFEGRGAVIGVSGGKDSSVALALLCEALTTDRVIAVLMPNGEQKDISDSYKICRHVGLAEDHIKVVNIADAYNSIVKSVSAETEQCLINIAPRLRMTTLYAIAQNQPTPYFVINTCNLSENTVGYATKWGDASGDYSLFENYTVTEIVALGDYMGLPYELVHKTPSDGLCGKSDEDNLGVSYATIDAFLYGEKIDEDDLYLILSKRTSGLHKLVPMKNISRL